MTDRRPLYVRLPETEALRLDEAAHRLKRSKQDLVASLITAYGDPDTLRRVTVETTDDRMTVGHAEFRPFIPPDVLTVDQLAAWRRPSPRRSRSSRTTARSPVVSSATSGASRARPCWTGSRVARFQGRGL